MVVMNNDVSLFNVVGVGGLGFSSTRARRRRRWSCVHVVFMEVLNSLQDGVRHRSKQNLCVIVEGNFDDLQQK